MVKAKYTNWAVMVNDLIVPDGTLQDMLSYTQKIHKVHSLAEAFLYRRLIRSRAPKLFLLALEARSRMDSGLPFFVVKGLPFIHYEERVRDAFLLGFLTCFGLPTPTDVVEGKVIWPVTPRKDLQYNSPTITERSGPADLHTDSSYRQLPERYVALFTVRPASDGGLTEILDGRVALEGLLSKRWGRKCYDILRSSDFAIRIPTAFTTARDEMKPEWITARLISQFLRFRYDEIIRGFACDPSHATRRKVWAVEYLNEYLMRCHKYTLRLEPGQLLLIDNFTALHGRTAFTDSGRLLLRVRLAGRSSYKDPANFLRLSP